MKDELKAVFLTFIDNQNMKVMFPQVSTKEDVDFAVALVNEVKRELAEEKMADMDKINSMEIGFMVETPAAVNNIRYLLRHSDFVSIGTNDLTELTFNIDRDDEAAAERFMKLQPMILGYIYSVLMAAKEINQDLPSGRRKKEVSICGDLARYKRFLTFLVAVSDGDIQLCPSMPPRFIPFAKELLRSLDVSECRAIFEDILKGRVSEAGDVDSLAQELIDRTIHRMRDRDEYKEVLRRVLKRQMEPNGALIGKVVDESGQIITEYITGEVKGKYLVLRDSRKPKKPPVARIRCDKEHVKEEMIEELTGLLEKSGIPKDSIEHRYVMAIIEHSMSDSTGFYVLKSDVRNIYGFANGDIFCLYEPFLSIPAAFFHEAGESFFLSNNYRAFLSQEIGHRLTDDEWGRYKGKARIVAGGKERLIQAHTYLRGLGKKARAKQREMTEAENLLPNGKGLEDLLFGEENAAVSRMIREQKDISQALRKLEEEDWVKNLIPELQRYTKLSNQEILLFLRELIQIQSVSKLLDLLLDRLNKTNLNLLESIKGLDDLLNVLLKYVPYTRVKRIMEVALRELRKPMGETGLEQWRKNNFIMKALVRFFRRIEKAELHHHLDGALSPELILKILCLFPEAREGFVREILGKKEGSVNEIFSIEIGGPKTGRDWWLLQYSLRYLFSDTASDEGDFIAKFGGPKEYNKAIRAIKRYLEYRPTEIGTVNIVEFLKKFGLTGLTLYCNPEALRIVAREATLETYRRDNTVLIEQKMHNLTFGIPLATVAGKVLQGLREAEILSSEKVKTALTLCIFKNPDLVLGDRYKGIVKAGEADSRSIEAIRYGIWQEIEFMLRNDFGDDRGYVELEKGELDEAIVELRRIVDRKMPDADTEIKEKEVRKKLLLFWEERKEGIRQVREIIRVKQQLAIDYPELAKKLIAIDTVGSEVDYLTWVHSYGLRLAKRYGFRIKPDFLII